MEKIAENIMLQERRIVDAFLAVVVVVVAGVLDVRGDGSCGCEENRCSRSTSN